MPNLEGDAQVTQTFKRCTRHCLLISIAPLSLQQISSLKLMQTGGDALLPDQQVKIAREDATLQKLRTLEQQYPDEAAAFAVLMSKPKKTAPAPTASAGVEKVEALALCSSRTHTPS
jgi:hypothetical protein